MALLFVQPLFFVQIDTATILSEPLSTPTPSPTPDGSLTGSEALPSHGLLEQEAAVLPTLTPDRGVPAWLFSFVLHTALIIILLLLIRPIQRGAGDVENRSGGIVLVNMEAKQTEFLDEGDVDSAAQQSESADSPPPAPSPTEELPPELPGLDSSPAVLTGVGEEISESLPGAEKLLESVSQNNRPIGGEVTTEVFGVKGTGTRFVYVFDRSASMEGYSAKPLKAAKQQLLKSLNSLGSIHQFQIIFYNDNISVFNPEPGEPQMLFASDEVKAKANRFVTSMRGDRGTDHLTALKKALSLAPDVVFLLTDAEGGLSPSELREVSRWNRSAAVINTIEFGTNSGPGSDRSLQRLATQNGGQYSYKNIASLRVN